MSDSSAPAPYVQRSAAIVAAPIKSASSIEAEPQIILANTQKQNTPAEIVPKKREQCISQKGAMHNVHSPFSH